MLYLLDTSHGSAASLPGCHEILAASSVNAPSNSSWTTELCRHLRNINRQPITVAQLYAKMMKSFAEGRLASNLVRLNVPDSNVLAPVQNPTTPYELGDPEDVRGMPMALISAQLKCLTDPPSIEEIKHLLTTHGRAMRQSVKIEVNGYHRTCFSGVVLVLLTLPISVWACLHHNPAYTFVRFVMSGNLGTAPLA